tara:strand:+ start:1089 stop:1304 length:216 start_codon:yes stop_codon:yes gene_type:complete
VDEYSIKVIHDLSDDIYPSFGYEMVKHKNRYTDKISAKHERMRSNNEIAMFSMYSFVVLLFLIFLFAILFI